MALTPVIPATHRHARRTGRYVAILGVVSAPQFRFPDAIFDFAACIGHRDTCPSAQRVCCARGGHDGFTPRLGTLAH